MAKGSSSPNQVLIIFLVFFILASIALGVTTYMGFDGQTALTADKNTAEKKKKEQEDTADWYHFQALLYRVALGEKLNDADRTSFNTLKDRYDKNRDLATKATLDTRKDDGVKAVDALLADKKITYDGTRKEFAKPYEDLLKDKDALIA